MLPPTLAAAGALRWQYKTAPTLLVEATANVPLILNVTRLLALVATVVPSMHSNVKEPHAICHRYVCVAPLLFWIVPNASISTVSPAVSVSDLESSAV